MVLDVHEATFGQISPSVNSCVRGCTVAGKSFYHDIGKDENWPVGRKSAIIAMNHAIDVLELDPSTRLQVPSTTHISGICLVYQDTETIIYS